MVNYYNIVKKTLVPIFYKEDQIGRSLGKKDKKFKSKFKNNLYKSINKLADLADSNLLNNKDIRREIKNVAKKSNVSLGQSQKTINTYLKYYCVLTGKTQKIIKELDCPLDSNIIKKYKNIDKNLREIKLKNLNDFKIYEKWQEHLKENGMGIRIEPDVLVYDKQRLDKFLK